MNRGLAGQIGVTIGQVAQSLRPAFAGIKAGDWVDPTGEMRDVNVRLAPEARQRASDLEKLPLVIPTPSGGSSTTSARSDRDGHTGPRARADHSPRR